MWGSIAAAASGITSGIGSIFSSMRNTDKTNQVNKDLTRETNAINKQIADQNLAFQQENLDYQKALQQQIFEREDSAYERTVNDMRNAGLSPLSMSGTNGAGQAIQTEAMNNSYQHQQYQHQAYDLSALATISQTLSNLAYNSAETDKLRSEARKADAEAAHITFGNKVDEMFGMSNAQYQNNMFKYNDKLSKADVAYQLFTGQLPSMTNEQKNMASIVQALSMQNSDDFKSFGFMNPDKNQKQTDFQEQSSNIGALMLANGLADLFKGLIPDINLSGISKRLNIKGRK